MAAVHRQTAELPSELVKTILLKAADDNARCYGSISCVDMTMCQAVADRVPPLRFHDATTGARIEDAAVDMRNPNLAFRGYLISDRWYDGIVDRLVSDGCDFMPSDCTPLAFGYNAAESAFVVKLADEEEGASWVVTIPTCYCSCPRHLAMLDSPWSPCFVPLHGVSWWPLK
jgi:hypothetical protein